MGRVRYVPFWGKKKKNAEPDLREERKKSGPIHRLWHRFKNIDWKNPVNRWKLLFASLVGCIIIFGGGYGVLSFTNSPSFCSSCHEMQPEYTTYTASSHSQIACVQCHIKPGTVTMMLHKVKSIKEVYYHVTGVPKQIVETTEEAVSNQNCLQCHSKNRVVTASGDLKVNHKGHIDDGIPCITCHSGVVHAKIASRDLNVEADRNKWTKENAQKLIEQKYLQPNMGTCIDCHEKVNKGEKPWLDPSYSVPPNPEETAKGEETKKTTQKTTNIAKAAEKKASSETAEATASHDESTQQTILQTIGKETKDAKVSMECSTCHTQTSIPKSHTSANWDNGHGTEALKHLDTCVNCHQDSKWEKQIPKQDIISLLKMGDSKVKYVPNMTTVKEEARTNQFCSACHAERPAGHSTSDKWLTAHAAQAKTNEQKAECYVCHDRTKPISGQSSTNAPTDVYCENCHRTGFKGESKN